MPDSSSENVSSAIGNWNICPLFTISVPMGLSSTGPTLETGGDGVKVGDGRGVVEITADDVITDDVITDDVVARELV